MARLKLEGLRAVELIFAGMIGICGQIIFFTGAGTISSIVLFLSICGMLCASIGRDRLLLTEGAEEGRQMRPPRELHDAVRQALPADVIDVHQRARDDLEAAKSMIAAGKAKIAICVDALQGVNERMVALENENAQLREVAAAVDQIGVIIGMASRLPARRRSPEPTQEPKPRPNGAAEYAPPAHREALTAQREPDRQAPAFLFKPEPVNLDSLERVLREAKLEPEGAT